MKRLTAFSTFVLVAALSPSVPPAQTTSTTAEGGNDYAYTIKINGLKMNPPTWTESGNPL